jgi:hypothetical protein
MYAHPTCIKLFKESAKRKRKMDADYKRQARDNDKARRLLQERVALQTDIVELHNARALLKVTQVRIQELEAKIVPCFCGELIYRKSVTCTRRECKHLNTLSAGRRRTFTVRK